ncbi:MAG TPA: ATP-binding protein [Gemmatimonadaceae bacterium]|nr:ATP-binding protein [Gemmatimonadaceae bacterium]
MRGLLDVPDDQLWLALDPRRFVRWIYVGRLTLATAILVAAISTWFGSYVENSTLTATLAFALSVIFTAWSAWYSVYRGKPLTDTFLYAQVLFDILLVTAVVHVTAQTQLSPFAALYIVVFASAALLLPIGSSLLVALFGIALYTADVFWLSDVLITKELGTQVGIFILSAVAVSIVTSRLQQAGASSRPLAAALSRARLEAADILGNIRSGILTIDGEGALLYANPAASELLGLNLQGYARRAVLTDIARVAPGLRAALERAVQSRMHTQREEALVTAGGRTFPIGVTTTSNEGDDNRVGRSITAIFQDISDQQRLEALRRRAERLEAVAELSASLAHEIRNPLASIRSAVEQLGGNPRSTRDEQTLSRLIVRESDRLSRLLGEFLDFARTRVTRVAPVDLADIARGAAKLAATHPSRAEGVEVVCTAPSAPVRLEGDEDLLHRAVFNLALNAVQAVGEGGHVRVEVLDKVDDVPAGVRFESGAVAVRVSDDGPGIDDEIRDRLFQPFATTKPGGSGLGLSLAHRAIEAHRGIVLVDSKPGGTRFTVILPVEQASADVPAGVSS